MPLQAGASADKIPRSRDLTAGGQNLRKYRNLSSGVVLPPGRSGEGHGSRVPQCSVAVSRTDGSFSKQCHVLGCTRVGSRDAFAFRALLSKSQVQVFAWIDKVAAEVRAAASVSRKFR